MRQTPRGSKRSRRKSGTARSHARRCSSPTASTPTRRSSAGPRAMTLTSCAASSRNSWPRVNANSSRVPHPDVLRNLTGPCCATSLGPVCRHHHRKPAPHKPPGPTRGSFTATGKATGTQNETEHSHWVPLAAATTGLGGPDLPDPRGGVTRSARAAKCARLPLPVARDERAGVEVAVWVRGAQQAHHEVHPRRREVLLHPRGVVGAHPVVVRERAAGVDERLLDRGLHHVVLAQALLVVGFLPVNICGAEGEGEVQARPGVVGVREVAHDEALHAHLVEGGVRGLHRGEVHLAEPVPRGGGLRHVAHRAPVDRKRVVYGKGVPTERSPPRSPTAGTQRATHRVRTTQHAGTRRNS